MYIRSVIGLCLACGLAGCAGVNYAHRTVGPVDQEAMNEASARVRQAEREERAERRRERREELMDQADAIRRAYDGKPPIYIIR